MNALVAKSYQGLKQIGEVYTINGKAYIKVELKNGTTKQVRVYSEAEYKKYYGETATNEADLKISQKEVLGFQKGYITIFKGDTYEHKDWFKANGCRYARYWGWYVVSTMEVPAELPLGIEAIKLNWEDVGEGDCLKPEDQVSAFVESLQFEPSPSEYQGSIGERLELTLTVAKAIISDSYYGSSTVHVMEDEDGNVFVWITTSKSWEVGSVKKIRGTVKEHKTYHGVKQTVLTRCTEVK